MEFGKQLQADHQEGVVERQIGLEFFMRRTEPASERGQFPLAIKMEMRSRPPKLSLERLITCLATKLTIDVRIVPDLPCASGHNQSAR